MYNYLKKIEELVNAPYDGLTEDEQRTVRKYNHFFPVNDSDCTMNKICHKFEKLEKELSLKSTKKSMLDDLVTEQKFDNDLLNAVENMAKIYKKQRQFLTRHNNSNSSDTNKNIANQTQERYSSLYNHLRNEILQLFEGDLKTAFNYMVKAVKLAKCEYHFVWNVLDDLIFDIIPSNTPYKKTEG